jgi:hypothetical protein
MTNSEFIETVKRRTINNDYSKAYNEVVDNYRSTYPAYKPPMFSSINWD